MSLHIVTTKEARPAADYLAKIISEKLSAGERVLWLVPGGSSITIAVEAAKMIALYPHKNLVVTLTDERFGPVGHTDSNWYKLKQSGFDLPEAQLFPVLTNKDLHVTVLKFASLLEKEFNRADYKLGFFGIGADGHTAGILPGSPAVGTGDLACGYETEEFTRITITPEAVMKLDEVVAYAVGEKKWLTLKKLTGEAELKEQPAQVLKKVKKFTLFTDYKNYI